MKRVKIQATFFIQVAHLEDAKDIAEDMLGDMVSEQYEHVESVTVLGEVEQDEFHSEQDEEDED